MGPGGIATIIAACSLLVIAFAIGYAVIRVGRFVDEAKLSLKVLVEEAAPLIEEVHTSVTLINGPLHSFNKISKNVEDISTRISETASSFLDKRGAAIKVAGALLTAAQMSKARAKKKKKAE